MLPNFFIVGTAKSGTTSIAKYLQLHPQVYICPIKEPNYFSYNEINKQNLYYKEKGINNLSEYENLYHNVNEEKAIGEASVSYLFYKNVPHRIKSLIQDAKIIIILRNPSERAFSHFLMDQRLGYVKIPFKDIILKTSTHSNLNLYYQQYIELGMYANQIKRYFEVFNPSQVKVFITEDLKDDSTKVVHSIFDFLQLDSMPSLNINKQYNVYQRPRNIIIKKLYALKSLRQMVKKYLPKRSLDLIKNFSLKVEKKPELTFETKALLNNLFIDDIKQTEKLIGRDLSNWYANIGEKN